MPDISIIIVNWNSKDYLRACLQSLAKHPPAGLTYEVIVVDGGSYDGCGEMLAGEFPAARFIQSPDNIGFARANNLGARHASGDTLLLLNPDTELIEDSLSVMYAAMAARTEIVAVGCRLLNADRTLQTSCVQSFPTVLNQFLDSEFLRQTFPRSSLWGMRPLYEPGGQPADVEVLSGACIMVRRDPFEGVGGFTESYFMYGEDLDLSYKLRQAGGMVCHVKATSLVHFGGGSTNSAASNFSTVMMRASVHRFLRLHRGPVSAFGYRLSTAVSALVRLVLIGPLLLFGKRMVRHGTGSWRKWTAVLRWSLGQSPKLPG